MMHTDQMADQDPLTPEMMSHHPADLLLWYPGQNSTVTASHVSKLHELISSDYISSDYNARNLQWLS